MLQCQSSKRSRSSHTHAGGARTRRPSLHRRWERALREIVSAGPAVAYMRAQTGAVPEAPRVSGVRLHAG
eukprot:741160-Prymnesium_polylepis.1